MLSGVPCDLQMCPGGFAPLFRTQRQWGCCTILGAGRQHIGYGYLLQLTRTKLEMGGTILRGSEPGQLLAPVKHILAQWKRLHSWLS